MHPYQRCTWPLSLIVLALWVQLLLLTSAQTEKQAPYPREWVPWNVTVESAYFFKVSPLSQAPVRPPQYVKDNRSQWPFVGGDGYLIVSKYSDSPAGPYSEVVYLPGKFQISNCTRKFWSVSRIWVDNPVTWKAGRAVWGFPKEMATFQWTKNNSMESVTVKDDSTGRVFLKATMERQQVDGAKVPRWVFGALSALTVVQWPIEGDGLELLATSRGNPATAVAKSTTAASVSYQQVSTTEGEVTNFKAANMRTAGSQEAASDVPLSAYNVANFWFAKAPKLSVVRAVSVQMSSQILTGYTTEKFTVSAYPIIPARGSQMTVLRPQKLTKC